MLIKIILIFVIVPFVELTLLLKISQHVGPFPTLALIVATGIIGGALARWQGLKTIRRLTEQINRSQFPTDTLADGGMILIAAVLLLTPGILTDLFGFSLLIPVCRTFYRKRLKSWFQRNLQVTANFRMNQSAWSPQSHVNAGGVDPNVLDKDSIIDGEVVPRHKTSQTSLGVDQDTDR